VRTRARLLARRSARRRLLLPTAGVADLGTVQLPQPARLRIDAPDDMKALELYARRADIDVRADEIAPRTRDVLLPAGRWLALWHRDGQLMAREVELTSGTTVTLRDVR
jgi:hypothetical protein